LPECNREDVQVVQECFEYEVGSQKNEFAFSLLGNL